METRMKKYNRQVSPERSKVWTEKSPKYCQQQHQQKQQKSRKVAVVYYLCRNRQLEHPHFIEVPLSSPNGLHLRDVIERLNVLRGRGMASMYSWSSKRSYKNGFVWHDLCEDDLILPAHGNEYILKGSELFEESSGSDAGNTKLQNLKQLPEQPSSSRSQDDSSSPSSMNGRREKHSQDDELSPPLQHTGSSDVSPESRDGKVSSWGGSLSLTEYKIYRNDGLTDASTQTEENVSGRRTKETCTRGVSTDDRSVEAGCNENDQKQVPCENENSEIFTESVSPPPSNCSASSSGGKIKTLESLIKADVSQFNSFRILEEGEVRIQNQARLKATNVLMQLISCGSISVKDHSFGLVPTYRPRFSHSKFPSPYFSTSIMLRELDCLSENPRLMGLRLEDKEYFSGSLVETKTLKEERDVHTSLKRSSSYNADRTCKELDSSKDKESNYGTSKCIPLPIKASTSKQMKNEPIRSPVSEKPRHSNDGDDNSRTISGSTSNGSSKRFTGPAECKKPSKRVDSFRDEKEKVIQIEERLASGARVVIQSKAPCESPSWL